MKKQVAIALISSLCLSVMSPVIVVRGDTPTTKEVATPSQARPAIKQDTDSQVPEENSPVQEEQVSLQEDPDAQEQDDILLAADTVNYEYRVEDGKAILTRYTPSSSDKNIIVPKEIDGYPVIGLEGTFQQNQQIENVTIPDGVEFLDNYCFSKCRNLKSIDLPDTLRTIGHGCFSESGIQIIDFPINLNKIGISAFEECTAITTLDLRNSPIEIIDVSAFYNCSNLKTVLLSEHTKTIDIMAFAGCSSLKTIDFSTSLEQIGSSAFSGCSGLTSIKLPDSIKRIGDCAFDNCNLIEEFIIPKNTSLVGDLIIRGDNLKRIVNLSDFDWDESTYKYYRDKGKWYLSESGDNLTKYLPAHSTIYRLVEEDINKPSNDQKDDQFIESILIGKYVEHFQAILDDIHKSGIKMSEANTIPELKLYVEKRLSGINDNEIGYEVEIETRENGPGGFVAAVAGTPSKPNGTLGTCGIKIHLWLKDHAEKPYIFSEIVYIHPTTYTAVSISGSGGGGGGSSRSGGGSSSRDTYTIQNLSISNPSIYSGKWINIGNRWKLQVGSGSYASSQWANIDGKWYLFGQDGYMLTGWKMVNQKWYYLESSGEMVTGWKWVDGKCYYMDQSGEMLSSTVTPDGFTVNEKGEWVQ